jgi:hypothetical protein
VGEYGPFSEAGNMAIYDAYIGQCFRLTRCPTLQSKKRGMPIFEKTQSENGYLPNFLSGADILDFF